MKRLLVFAALTLSALAQSNGAKRLSYADFSTTNGEVLSSRGGLVHLFGFEQNKKARSTFTNSEGVAPHLPMIAPAEGSMKPRISYAFELKPQNQFAGVVLQIRGLPDKSGKQAAEDVSSYQFVTINADFEGTNAIQAARNTMGKTNPLQAEAGTIRGDLGLETGRNLVHGSDGPGSAAREIELFFRREEMLSDAREMDRWVFEE